MSDDKNAQPIETRQDSLNELDGESQTSQLGDESESAAEEAPESKLFRFVIIASVAFLVTVLIMSVASFSDSKSPIPTFFNAHGLKLVAIEVGLILLLGLAAMIVDRRQTLAWQARQHQRQVDRSLAIAEEAQPQSD
jgi:preprotein translocase subunit SecG